MLPMVQPEPILFNCGGSSVETASAPSVGTSPPSLTPDSDANDLDIFFDIDVDIHTFQRIESCDLQPGDTWRGMQGKMSLAAPAKKIRTNKKSDNSKPQSQINKCTNEKRRRELENETINQLEELLGTCLAEVKQPDKNGIVREATRQIQEVLNHRRECPDECPVRVQCLSPVQGGEVSSTQPQPSNQLHYSEITTLIEALKHYTNSLGWILLELNPQGEVECVTENIKELINQDRTDLYKKSIFSLLHIEDHSKLRPLLRDTQVYGWGGAPEIDKFQAIKARLIDHSDGTDDSGVVECVIHCAPVGVGAGGGAGGAAEGRVMCVIRRCTDASPALLPGDAGALPQAQHALSDHIVFRLDSSFTILSCEVNSAENLINSPSSLVGGRYLELVESSARLVAATHLRSATGLPAPPSISEPFRLRLAADRPWLRVIARSRLFSKLATGEPDFIMSSHELLADDDDGERVPPSPAAAAPPAAEPYLDFDMEGWGAPYLPEHADHAGPAKERRDEPDPAPPPAPPPVSHPAQPPAPRSPPDDPPNRLRLLLSKKPESTNRILKDLLKQEEEEATTSSDVSAPHTPLTPGAALSPLQPRPHHAHAMHHQVHHHHQNNSDMIIKMLHNSDEDSEPSREGRSGGSQPSALLSQLLQTNGPSSNGRSSGDGDYFERMAGVKRKFEEAKGSSPATTTVKRATPDNQQQVTSSASSGNSASVATTSSGGGMSPLCQKNQILVSLLAKQQSTPLPPPAAGLRTFGPRAARAPAPPPLAPPHHHQRQPSALGQILTQSQSNMNGGGSPGVVRDAPGSHLESMLQSTAYNNANLQYASPAPAHYSHHQPAGGNRPTAGESGDSEVPSDKYLSDILEFIANMPDDRAIPAVLDLDTNQQIRPDYGSVKNEKAMINAITQSLMQCETASKSRASSSPAPPSYPTHSQGNMSSMSNLGSPMGSSMGSNMGSMGVGAAGRYEAAAAAAAAAAECRARGLSADHQRARLLQQQRAQQMLVSPEAAEQPQSDLGSTISALVTATPPNVTLTRTDYHHHLYHSPSQMGQNYGSNKITSSQQNPMLSRQLSVGSSTSGYGQHPVAQHSPALHTPMTPQSPYQRPPRPQLVGAGGYYDESYGGDYRRGPHAPLPAPHEHLPCVGGAAGAAGAAGGGTSEYVRNELRAVVGARAARPDLHPPMQPPDIDPLISFDISHSGGGGAGAGEAGGRSWELSAASTTGAGSAAAEGGDAAAAASNPSLLQKLLSQ